MALSYKPIFVNGVSRASERGGFVQARVNNFRMAEFLLRVQSWVTYDI